MILFKNELGKKIFILLFCLIISGIIGVLFVEMPNFDFYSYHFYSGWAFLNNRLDIDFLPCQARSYFNPILDSINFYLIQKLNNHPYLFLFISNFKYGVYLFLTYLISDFVFKDKTYKNIGIFSSLFLVILSPVVIFSMRMDFTDIQSANIILISLYIQIKYIFTENSRKKYLMLFLSALIMGFGIGLKNSSIVFAIPMIISTLIYLKKDYKYLVTILLMLLGGILGFLVTDGWWKYLIWTHFYNPLFPYSNHIFNSPMADINNFTNTEYAHILPKNTFDYIFGPLKDTIKNSFIGLETPYFEPKMRLTFAAVIVISLMKLIKSLRDKLNKIIETDILMIFLIYIILGYYINSGIFGTLRYVIALFVLSSIVITALSMTYTKSFRGKIIYPAIVGVIILCSLTFYFESNNKIVARKITSIVNSNYRYIPDNSTVLCGNQTACFIAPFLNPKIKFVAFTIPKHIREKSSLWVEKETKYKNYYYYSEYLENKNKEIFEKEKSLYIIFNPITFYKDIKVYNESLEYYTNKKIKSTNNCDIKIFSVFSNLQYYLICKLK